jgi:hypothetical protein
VAATLGVLLGGVAVHLWDAHRDRGSLPTTSSPTVDLRFSLGARTGDLLASHGGAAAIAVVSVVVSNDGRVPVTVTGIEVNGPGSGFVASPAGGPSTGLPQVIDAGASTKIRFGMSSTCALAVRPVPAVIFLVRDPTGRSHAVRATIPDLDTVWGQTLLPPACAS